MFPSFLSGKDLRKYFERRMNLFSMCIHVIAKPDVIQMHSHNLDMIPQNIKTAIFTILCKRGYIKDVLILKNLVNPGVTEMDLSECVVTDEFLTSIISCKNIRKLDLSLRRRQCRYITTEVLASLFPHLPYLKIIAIPHCKEVTDQVIESITQNCRYIVELHIPNSNITDASLKLMGDNLSHLSVINILGTEVTDAGIKYLITGPLAEHITEINIDKCPNVTLSSNRMIDQHCLNLKIFTCGAYANEDSGITMNGISSKAKQVFWSV